MTRLGQFTDGELVNELKARGSWIITSSNAINDLTAERALADDLAADLAKYVNRSDALARYREARQR